MNVAPQTAPLRIEITWRLRMSWAAQRLLQRVAQHVAAAEGFRTGRLSVAVVGVRAMTTLNERFADRAEPTDVLAFDLGTDRRRAVLDGEIVICADVARRRCREALRARLDAFPSRSRLLAAARGELALYVTHGLLHLAGYEDRTPAGFRRMHSREDRLLTELELGPLYTRGPA